MTESNLPPQDPPDNPRRGSARARHERRKQRLQHSPPPAGDTPPDASPPDITPRTTRAPDTDPAGMTPIMPASAVTPPRTRREREPRLPLPPNQLDWRPRGATPRGQVTPSGARGWGFLDSLAEIDWRLPRLIAAIIGGLILIVGVIVGLNLFKDETPVKPPDAIWIGTEWTYRNQGEDAVTAFAQQLQADNIGTVYAWVSWLKDDGTWAGIRAGTNTFEEVRADVETFVRQFKAAYPLAELHGWIGVPVELGPDGYRLNDPVTQQIVADFSLFVIEDLGFDGVFLNVEQVWNDNADDFVTLLLKVRGTLGDRANISVAIPPDWSPINPTIPVPPLIRPGTEWDKTFKQRVALLTDQMAIMAYNSGLSDPNDYVEWMAYQVQVYAEALEELRAGARLIIGIPTYDDEPPGHLTAVENIPTAIAGVRKGLLDSGTAAARVQGVAIYAGWTTSDQEWQQYRELWARTRN